MSGETLASMSAGSKRSPVRPPGSTPAIMERWLGHFPGVHF